MAKLLTVNGVFTHIQGSRWKECTRVVASLKQMHNPAHHACFEALKVGSCPHILTVYNRA